MGAEPFAVQAEERELYPVQRVNWIECANRTEGNGLRPPLDREWCRAARAEATTEFFHRDDEAGASAYANHP
ncbi:MAG: sulfatase activating formylglycine-generating enzyme [Planctomycetota bacterium]